MAIRVWADEDHRPRLLSARGPMTRVVLAPLGRLCEALGKPLLMPVAGRLGGRERATITDHQSLAVCAWNRPYWGICKKPQYARTIRATVRRDTGIPVSIGIGPTKTLAKVANHLAKPQPETGGVLDLSRNGRRRSAGRDRDTRGVGRRAALGQVAGGARHHDSARPEAGRPEGHPAEDDRGGRAPGPRVERPILLAPGTGHPPRQGLTVSRSFGQTLTALRPIKDALLAFVGRAGEKLRRQGLMAGQVLVFVTTNRFSTMQPFYANSATVRLPYPTDFTPDLVEAAMQLLERLYRPGFHYQTCGVMLLDLSPVHAGAGRPVRRAGPAPRGLADAGAGLPQYGLRRAHRAGRERRRDTPRLGDATGLPQPALYDALAGVAGRAIGIPRTLDHAL